MHVARNLRYTLPPSLPTQMSTRQRNFKTGKYRDDDYEDDDDDDTASEEDEVQKVCRTL